jgi:hypothetical protein
VVGAVGASVPDVEHVLPLPRPGGRKLFPSHRVRGWHRAGGIPASVQLRRPACSWAHSRPDRSPGATVAWAGSPRRAPRRARRSR